MSDNTSTANGTGWTKKLATKTLTGITALIAVLWAILEYIFPDPLIYFYSIWKPEYVIVLFTIFVSLIYFSIFIWTYLKNKVLFFISAFLLYFLTSFAFFILGKEYQDPTFSDGMPTVTAESGSVYYRGIEFEHNNCSREGESIACTIEVFNARSQKRVSVNSWRLVMKDGAVFNDVELFRGGQKQRWNSANLDLPQGAEAKLEVVFYGVAQKYSDILKLGFEVQNQEFGFKSISIL
ncbi:hypothetical protein [Marinobacter nauticus]|uniref:hypothetical protein n=1 Tax=Marinobacter nauticus TaxID=2743 RepID=UPI004044DE59